MAELTLHRRPVSSVFELLGSRENDITYSLGWALAHSPTLTERMLASMFPKSEMLRANTISLQDRDGDGITDIEIRGPRCHVIVEAKRGWTLPSELQLRRYAPRLTASASRLVGLLSMSEATADYARLHLPPQLDGVRVHHVSWRDVATVAACARAATRSLSEKHLLVQLRSYLARIVSMQNQESNLVYVVSLSRERPEWSSLTWIDIVAKQRRYFHPVGPANGWPKEPPNYLGFRYGGQLRAVHHVDGWEIVDNLDRKMKLVARGNLHRPHFLYTLGPPIPPPTPVRTGTLYRNGRVWAMLDLLLTCETVSEARDRTKARMQEQLG